MEICRLKKKKEKLTPAAQGFPTILFWPKDAKQSPIVYERGRDLPEFLSFLKEKARFEDIL
jgi:hypothetical protein